MSTTAPQISNGLNGGASPCPTKKKFFSTSELATEFESTNSAKYNLTRQYVYKCEQCTGYHLSALSEPAEQMTQQTDYTSLASMAPMGVNHLTQNQIDSIKRLHKEGRGAKEIAAMVACVTQKVYYHIRKANGGPLTGRKQSGSGIPSTDLVSIQTEEQRLEAQLNALRAKKQQIIDAKKLKVKWYTNNGSVAPGKVIQIAKEGEHMIITLETANELVSKLEELLTTPPNVTQ